MSDNLEVAKECGAVETGKYTIELRVSQLDSYTARRLASQQAAHDAEIARLKEANQQVKTDSIGVIETLKAARAMKDAALKTCITVPCRPGGAGEQMFNEPMVDAALSASTQQVSDWERKQLGPIKNVLLEWRKDHISDSQLAEFIDQFTRG